MRTHRQTPLWNLLNLHFEFTLLAALLDETFVILEPSEEEKEEKGRGRKNLKRILGEWESAKGISCPTAPYAAMTDRDIDSLGFREEKEVRRGLSAAARDLMRAREVIGAFQGAAAAADSGAKEVERGGKGRPVIARLPLKEGEPIEITTLNLAYWVRFFHMLNTLIGRDLIKHIAIAKYLCDTQGLRANVAITQKRLHALLAEFLSKEQVTAVFERLADAMLAAKEAGLGEFDAQAGRVDAVYFEMKEWASPANQGLYFLGDEGVAKEAIAKLAEAQAAAAALGVPRAAEAAGATGRPRSPALLAAAAEEEDRKLSGVLGRDREVDADARREGPAISAGEGGASGLAPAV